MGIASTAAAYAAQLRQLLPRGPLWQWREDSPLVGLLLALAAGLSRFHLAAARLPREADPRTTSELLAEWEASCGLPDGCLPGGGSADQRRNAIVARLVATGGASRAYFIEIAAVYGYTITITEPALHTWRVNSTEDVSITPFRAGLSRAGEPLRTFGNQQLECLINRIKPAHTVVEFAYGV